MTKKETNILGLGPLPKFLNPPVHEVVLAAQFEPPRGFANAHIGRFWDKLDRKEWCRVVDADAVKPAVERFGGDDEDWEEFLLSWDGPRLARTQIVTDSGDRMIQIDRHWFTYNWRRCGEQEYPSFNAIQPEFDHNYEVFSQVLEEGGVSGPRAKLWEAIYVNKLPEGTVWKDPSDLAKVFPALLGNIDIGFAEFADLAGHWAFTIRGWRARLRVQLHTRIQDGERIVQMAMIARGPIGSDNGCAPTVRHGHNIGHEAIVHGFARLTSSESHKHWERRV